MYTRRGPREFVLRTISHNVRSLRQKEAIELVIDHMRKKDVDAGDLVAQPRERRVAQVKGRGGGGGNKCKGNELLALFRAKRRAAPGANHRTASPTAGGALIASAGPASTQMPFRLGERQASAG